MNNSPSTISMTKDDKSIDAKEYIVKETNEKIYIVNESIKVKKSEKSKYEGEGYSYDWDCGEDYCYMKKCYATNQNPLNAFMGVDDVINALKASGMLNKKY